MSVRRPSLLAVSTLCSALLWVSAATAAPGGKAAPKRGRLALVGSSSINDSFGHLVEHELQEAGWVVARKGYGAAGLSRPDFKDWMKLVHKLPVDRQTDGVIVYLGGNDAQPLWIRKHERKKLGVKNRDPWIRWKEKKRWNEVYADRMAAFINALCKKGAKKVVVLPPADVTSRGFQRKLDRVRAAQKRGAKQSKCGTFVATTGDVGRFKAGGKATRAHDGTHMTRHGARIVWKRVEKRALAAFK